jgi:predicted DNA-binding transcriptional regulator YafY
MQEMLTRIKRLDQLIKIKGTGSPAQLASKVGVSERTVFEYLKLMKSQGAPIQYDRGRKSYSYLHEGTFTISFVSAEDPFLSNK